MEREIRYAMLDEGFDRRLFKNVFLGLAKFWPKRGNEFQDFLRQNGISPEKAISVWDNHWDHHYGIQVL